MVSWGNNPKNRARKSVRKNHAKKDILNFMLFGKMIFDAKGNSIAKSWYRTILELNETSKYLFSLILRNRKRYSYA